MSNRPTLPTSRTCYKSSTPPSITVDGTNITQQQATGTEADPQWRSSVAFQLVVNEPLYKHTATVRDGDQEITIVRKQHSENDVYKRDSVFALTDAPNGGELRTRFDRLPYPPRGVRPLTEFNQPVYVESSDEGQKALALQAGQRKERYANLQQALINQTHYQGSLEDGAVEFDVSVVFTEPNSSGSREYFTVFEDGAVIRGTVAQRPDIGAILLEDRELFAGIDRYPNDVYQLSYNDRSGGFALQGFQAERRENVPFRVITLYSGEGDQNLDTGQIRSIVGESIPGVLDHERLGDIPFTLKVSSFDPSTRDVSGSISYPGREAVNQFEGHFVGGRLIIEEVNYINKGDWELGSQYSISLSPGSAEGIFLYPKALRNNEGTVSLSL